MVRRDGTARGQVFTVEGFVAAFLLLASIAFALQMTAVSPLSASTSSQHVQNQQAALVSGVLDTARADGSLDEALRYWNPSDGVFHGSEPPAGEGYYTACTFPTAFGELLGRTFDERGVACNVNLHYVNATTGAVETRRLVHMGVPTDDAVRATTLVTLYDDDELLDSAGTPTGTTLGSVPDPDATPTPTPVPTATATATATPIGTPTPTAVPTAAPTPASTPVFYAADADGSGPVYNVVQVEVVVWRT